MTNEERQRLRISPPFTAIIAEFIHTSREAFETELEAELLKAMESGVSYDDDGFERLSAICEDVASRHVTTITLVEEPNPNASWPPIKEYRL
jgi:hypothetical protein